MNIDLLHARKAIQNARAALRGGDRRAARGWAEQAAKLAPGLEDPWLILAAVASPEESVTYLERALQINPDSPHARKGMGWALKRLKQAPPAKDGEVPPNSGGKTQETSVTPRPPVVGESRPAGTVTQAHPAKGSARPKKAAWRTVYPYLLLALGCVAIIFAVWIAGTSPALASILSGVSQPVQAAPPPVWAQVEIAKPAAAPDGAQVAGEVEPTLAPPTSTPLPPTPTLEPTLEPTAAPPTATSGPDSGPGPTLTPEATATSSGSLVLEIVEDTPVPTSQPAGEDAAPTAKPDPPVGNGVRWIEVNLTEQRVYAWEGDVLINSFVVSTGTWQTPTVIGTFQIWNKTRIQTMSGPGYSLPNVPWVMYFYKDYGFHGTYWHNNFGTPMSHGCVNLTIPDSEWLYNWASYGTTVKVHY